MTNSTANPPKVVLLHAYSPKNAGDGLLVQLAEQLIADALGTTEIVVIAADASAFARADVTQWGGPIAGKAGLSRNLSMVSTVFLGPSRSIRAAVAKADLVVAVGGGYLRGGHFLESLKSLGAHYGQLRLAATVGEFAVYLPQSIGPFHGVYLTAIRSRLRRISSVMVRDDRSARDLATVSTVERIPDLAVLEIAKTISRSTQSIPSGPPVVVARNLKNPRHYYDLLAEIASTGSYDWAVQSEVGANNDRPLTERFAKDTVPTLSHIFEGRQPRIIISTRMHGALSALLKGFPAIHLSYERKGWGAFDDLGLPEYVLPARDAQLETIRSLELKIMDDPQRYWNAVRLKMPEILAQHTSVVQKLRDTARRPPGSTAESRDKSKLNPS